MCRLLLKLKQVNNLIDLTLDYTFLLLLIVNYCLGPTYKLQKARLGMRRVRPWVWAPFVNPAREDGVAFCHWRRVVDEGKEYPFAKFNKVLFVNIKLLLTYIVYKYIIFK